MSLKLTYIALGTNLGDRLENLREAIVHLESKNVGIITRSSRIYENQAIGIKEGNDFYNVVIQVYTELAPELLLKQCQQIESEMGREKSDVWINRIIDIDLLFIDGVDLSTDQLTLPHPGITARDFVLVPLCELDSNLKIKGQTVQEHLSEMGSIVGVCLETILYPKTQINQIVAVSENGVIGADGKLPWSIAMDWLIFLKKTKKGVLIMGRVSFLEMIKEPNWDRDREYIVLSSSKQVIENTAVTYVHSVDEAMHRAKLTGKTIWICGGATIYEATFNETETLYLTRINQVFKGDTFFADYRQFLPKCISKINSCHEQISFSFEIWSR